MRRILTTAMALAIMICFSTSLVLAADLPKLVGLTIPEAGTDKGWNEQGKVGLEATAAKYGFKIELVEALGYGDIKPTLRDMDKKGSYLINCHDSGNQTDAHE
ncbi:MAG: hypothetical protein N2F24_10620, partial [Deltaproteobacteria bacterium]